MNNNSSVAINEEELFIYRMKQIQYDTYEAISIFHEPQKRFSSIIFFCRATCLHRRSSSRKPEYVLFAFLFTACSTIILLLLLFIIITIYLLFTYYSIILLLLLLFILFLLGVNFRRTRCLRSRITPEGD